MPTRSPESFRNNSDTSRLAFSNLLGRISSDFILKETSKAIKRSMPLRFTSSRRVPTCGFATARIKQAHAIKTRACFTMRIARLASGASWGMSFSLTNRRSWFLCHMLRKKYPAPSAGISSKNHRYSGCSKRNIITDFSLTQKRSVQFLSTRQAIRPRAILHTIPSIACTLSLRSLFVQADRFPYRSLSVFGCP